MFQCLARLVHHGEIPLASLFFTSVCRPLSLLQHSTKFSTTNSPIIHDISHSLSIHVRNPSRRVHLVSVNPLASYSTWFACFFALFYWAATKPPSVFSNSFSNISFLAKTSKPLLRSQISFFSVVLVSPIRSLISDDWGPRTLGGFSSAYPPKW